MNSVSDCVALCERYTECTAWRWYQRPEDLGCGVLGDVTEKSKSTSWVSGCRGETPPVVPSICNGTATEEAGKYFLGLGIIADSTLVVATVAECRAHCEAHPECKAWRWSKSYSQECLLLTEANHRSDNAGMVSGCRDAAATSVTTTTTATTARRRKREGGKNPEDTKLSDFHPKTLKGSSGPPPIDILVNPSRAREQRAVAEFMRTRAELLFDPKLLKKAFPALFQLLQHSRLPCTVSNPSIAPG